MGYPQNPHPEALHMHSSFPEPPNLIPCNYQSMQSPYMFSFQHVNHKPVVQPMGQNDVHFGMPDWQPQGWSHDDERAWKSKIARDRRKQALQRSRSSNSSEICAALIPQAKREVPIRQETKTKNPYKFCAPDGKMLRDILTKKLRSCDVGSLGRIVLPKKESEKNLPALHSREGIQILLKDVFSNQHWNMKFKYWANANSRMYILENTGEFIKYYQLQIGDSITLYEDKQKNLYVSARKQREEEREASSSSNKEGHQSQNTYNNSSYIHAPYSNQAKDEEEEACLALLIEELRHKEQEEASNCIRSLCSG
ncbi:B3 domain-containing transcription factor LEC2 [Senna tora]|uniref:B3 domain-containing transcription factor LEC2 n=1 Tax=Senna tora TaxID=362788 RepID=A0A834SM57_9FABA|nr:B3 domain-containing transcription factor LEC2 [Senna tora]